MAFNDREIKFGLITFKPPLLLFEYAVILRISSLLSRVNWKHIFLNYIIKSFSILVFIIRYGKCIKY